MSKLTKERYHLIDALRGLSIILMLAHHFGFTLLYFGFNTEEILASPVLGFLSPFFAGIFILISGMSSRFSQSNIKRGIITLLFALALSLVSYLFGVPVWFGILHFLGLSMLFYGLLAKWIEKIPLIIGIPLLTFIFIFCFVYFPRSAENNILYWFGFVTPDSGGVDFFPFGKWISLFLLGSLLGLPVKEHKLPQWFYNFKMPFLPFVGRHTLIIYLAHQPFFYALLSVYIFICGRG